MIDLGTQALRRASEMAGQAQEATAASDTLQAALQTAAESKLRQRSPEEFRAVLEQMGRNTDGTPTQIYVDGEVLNQLAPDVRQLLPQAVQEQIQRAAEIGDTVAIPVADVLTVAPGTALEQVLVENARLRPDAMTQAEARAAGDQAAQYLQQEAQRVIEQARDQEAMRASAEAVRTSILGELNAAGRFRPQVNEAMSQWASAFYTTMASRVGMTPEEFYQRYRLRVLGEAPAGQGPVIEQGALVPGATVRQDGTDAVIEGGSLTLIHGSPNANLTLDQIQIVRDGQKQGKKGRKYGGFYLSPVEDVSFAEGYANMDEGTPTVYEVRVRQGTKVLQKEGDITRLSEAYITELLAQGYGVVVGKDPRGRTEYAVIDKNALESMVIARADAARGETFEQVARVTTGRPLFEDIVQALGLSEQEFNATALEYMTGLPGGKAFLPPSVGGLTDVVAFLHERRLQAGLPVLDITKPEDRTQLARLVAAEALAAIRNAGDSLEWYDTTVAKTLSMMAVKYPELDTDPNARNAFLVAVAISSQGMNVEDNLAFARQQYEAFRSTGAYPIVGKGESSQAMADNFEKANKLLAEMGPDLFRRFLVTPFTVRELGQAGFDVGGENQSTIVLGSSIFGPKIGFGFYSNLNGNFEPVTMDMWFMRTIGRLAGTLPAFEPAKFVKQVQRLRDATRERGRKERGIYASQFDADLVKRARTDENAAIELARQVKRAHERDFRNNRAAFNAGTRIKTDLVGAAETILFSLEKPKDVPASGGERNLLRDVTAQVVDLVAQHYGQRIPPAALQALIWYPEQEFYKAMGVRLRVTSQDYAGAARKLLLKEGIDGVQLDGAAERGAAGTRPEGGAAVAAGAAGNVQGTGRARPLTPTEQSKFIIARNARILAEQRAAAARIAFEVAPDPNDLALTAQWRQLTQEQRLAISDRVSRAIVPRVMKFLKAKGEVLPQVGSYLEDTNPSFALRVDKGDVDRLAKILGFVLSQDSMMAIAPAEFPGAFGTQALRIAIGEKTSAEVDQIYQTLRAITLPDGRRPITGQSTSGGVMTVLLDSQDDAATIGALVDQALAGAYNVTGHDVFAAFPEKQDYDYGLPESDPAGDEGVARQRARDARAQASDLLRAELDAIAAEQPVDGRGGQPDTFAQQPIGDRAGRPDSAGPSPLPGAPIIAGATGPDPRIVAVAGQYARDNGIPLRRQGEYAQVDPERAARIAAAYDAMVHAPQDPAVREAYENLIQQTMAQYRALEAAGYRFWFIDPTNDPYKSPWDALRDLRATQSMGVFPTAAGFGSAESDTGAQGNLMESATDIMWPYGSPDGELRPVLANDLFRAVHDAFGHGLEGAGFREQGEENAWQAHIRLFTGSARGAITSETRGQNSWLNYGPYGESNRTAKVEDTVFADQKTGLMPEWTWSEGIVEDMPDEPLAQGPRGTFNPRTLELVLSPTADLSTFFHETGHFFLEVMADIASRPDAPAMIQEDMAKILAWFGVPDLATWNSMTLDQQRPYHERWAESIEQYVMEGKAPSVELAPVMRRFSAWLKSVYRSIQQFLAGRPDAERQPLNDDIRRVMDRMLAVDEQIQQANEVAGLMPDEQADGEAAERLQKRSMADLKWAVKARDKVIAKIKREAREIEKTIRAEVTAEVDATPEMQAKGKLDELRKTSPEYKAALKAWQEQRQAAKNAAAQTIRDNLLATEGAGLKGLKKGQFLARKNREIENQAEAAALAWEAQNLKPERPMAASDLEVAAIADAFGYTSVDAMLQAIDAYGSRAEAIDGIVERRMLEEHGDLIDERAIIEAANEAVHNEARARSLATELRTQQEMLGQRRDTGETTASGARRTVNILVEAAKQFGANVIARTPLRDLRATAWKHTSAERRAGKRWQEATAKGDTQAAVKAKQDQMLNNAAAKAALDAAAEAKKILEFFARVTKGTDEKTVEKGRDPDIVNAARAVLAAYGVQTPASKGAAAYLETLKSNDPETYAALEPMMAAAMANAQPLEALTFEELTGLHESIRAFWFMAKRSRQMEVNGNLLDIDDVAQELFARMEQIGIPDRIPGEGMAVTRAEERGLFLKQGIAFLRRVEAWAEGMDGKYGGPFLRFVFQPIKDAADRYRKDRLDYRKRFQALVDNLAPIVGDSIIEAPELGYTFGTPGSTAGTAMNEILHAIAHTGNDSNKRKLLLGRGWATENPDGTLNTTAWDAFLRRLVNEGKLQREHMDFVQGVWDLLEDTKPLAQKAHRDAFGRYFSEVTANEFVDPFGVTRRGGYVPAQVDTRLVKDNVLRKMAEEQNNSMAYSFPQPAKGFTISRTEYNQPLMLDLRSLSQHIDKVLLFSHMTNPARDVRKLITRKTVSQPLDRIQPATIESMLQPWLQRSAQQVVETPIVGTGRWARLPGIIRSRAGMALMFANVSNAVQQITGLANAAVRVKPSFLMRSLAQYVSNPREFSRAVWGASPYMDDRAKNEVAVLNEQMQAILLKPSTFERAQDFSMRHAYFLQTALDNVLSPIVWTGAFNQALADGMTDADAVRFADSTVRQTQGSTLPEDVSRLETGPAYARVFTQFVGYFNMMANTNATALKQIIGEVGLKKGAGRALYVVMMGLMVPIWAAEAIAIAFRGGPEDEDDDGWLDDWLAEVFGMGTLKGLLAQIPIAGQFAVAGLQRFNDNPLDDRVSLSPAVSLIESSVGAPQSVYKAIVDEGSAQKAIRDVATLVSVATGVPLYGVARPIGYAAGVAQGRIEPEGPLDVARGLITGTASPESRVP